MRDPLSSPYSPKGPTGDWTNKMKVWIVFTDYASDQEEGSGAVIGVFTDYFKASDCAEAHKQKIDPEIRYQFETWVEDFEVQ